MNTSKSLHRTNPETGLIEIYRPIDIDDSTIQKILDKFTFENGLITDSEHRVLYKIRNQYPTEGRCFTVYNPLNQSAIGRIIQDPNGHNLCLMVEKDFITFLNCFKE